MKIKISELSGIALEWAIASLQFGTVGYRSEWGLSAHYKGIIVPQLKEPDCYFNPISWKTVGPILLEADISLLRVSIFTSDGWVKQFAAYQGCESAISSIEGQNFDPAFMFDKDFCFIDKDPCVAALRCYVKFKMPNSIYVEVPDDVLE